jgi:acetyl-CoA carboxylase biotin carboxyl carrier protein
MRDGRRFVPERQARAEARDLSTLALFAPQPGLYRGGPGAGALVLPGSPIGELEVLGTLYRLRAPDDAFGIVVAERGKRVARRAVDATSVLFVLDPEGARDSPAAAVETASESGGPVFRTPLGGRYYARPSPSAEPFVRVGDVLDGGETVALIEVMKTFNRVTYGGAHVPKRARVRAIVRADGDDVEAGDVLLELEEEE